VCQTVVARWLKSAGQLRIAWTFANGPMVVKSTLLKMAGLGGVHGRLSCVRQVQQFDHGAGYDPGVEPPASVAAVAARWFDRLQLLEVEFGNGVQLLGQPRSFGGYILD
jgi:hypothetical protein